MIPLTLLGQIASSPLSAVSPESVLIAYGPMGIMLVWFMWRFEALQGSFRSLSSRIDGMTKALLVDVMSRPTTGPNVRQAAGDMLAEMEARSKVARGD